MFRREMDNNIEQLSSSIYEIKQRYIKDIVDVTIQDIEIERHRLEGASEKVLMNIVGVVENRLSGGEDILDLVMDMDNQVFKNMNLELVLVDVTSGKVLAQINSDLNMSDAFDDKEQDYHKVNVGITNSEEYRLLISINQSSLEETLKANIIDAYRDKRFLDEGYVWFNEILDYNGGDGYAIRRMHPNLPETEGLLLSTETEDLEGNKPYEIELNGIVKEGELYYDYYFKKMASDEIAHKLSYAKLYEPFDWVIATGIYLDDIGLLIESKTIETEKAIQDVKERNFLISVLCLVIALVVIFIFERMIGRLIRRFQTVLNEKNDVLKEEKEIIEQIAFLDPLTGLLNRRGIEEQLKEAHMKAEQAGASYGIMMIDLDYFKAINDEFSHMGGDYALKEIAKILRQTVRQKDLVGRWGGEEFLILLNQVGQADAYEKAEQIRDLIDKTNMTYEGQIIHMTTSIGVEVYNDAYSTVTEIIANADKKLYQAKDLGRNKVVG